MPTKRKRKKKEEDREDHVEKNEDEETEEKDFDEEEENEEDEIEGDDVPEDEEIEPGEDEEEEVPAEEFESEDEDNVEEMDLDGEEEEPGPEDEEAELDNEDEETPVETKSDPASAPAGAREMANVIRHYEGAMDYLDGNTSSHEPEYGESTHQMIKDMVGEGLGRLNEEAASRYPNHDMKAIADHEAANYEEKGEEDGAGEFDEESEFPDEEEFEYDPEKADAVTDEILERYKNPKSLRKFFRRLKAASDYLKGLSSSKSVTLPGKHRGRLQYHAKALGELYEGVAGQKSKPKDANGVLVHTGDHVRVKGVGSGTVQSVMKSGVVEVKLSNGHRTWVKSGVTTIESRNDKTDKVIQKRLDQLAKKIDSTFGLE